MRQYSDPKKRDHAVENILNIYQGGMGSFADLMMCKNYKIPIGVSIQKMENYDSFVQENDIFNALRTELFDACDAYQENNN